VPELEKTSSSDKGSSTANHDLKKVIHVKFQERVVAIFEDFADFKIAASYSGGGRDTSHAIKNQDVYCKLISKQILFLLQVPC